MIALETYSYLSAALVGLLGGVHCVGMCGGIVGALGLGLPESARRRFGAALPFLLAYNAGRIGSYAIAGAFMGALGVFALEMTALQHAQLALQALAGLFMIGLGLYLGGWWFGLARLERMGGGLWRHLEPIGRRLLPVRSTGQALLFGVVWGWLPCGLVYSVLLWSLSAGSPGDGALLMVSFGLGTLPTLLTMGAFAARLAHFTRRIGVRRVAGALVLGFGLLTVWRALSPSLA
jgi:sulfite exporter TauE/SafE